MSTDVLEEVDLASFVGLDCHFDDGKPAKWIIYWVEKLDCCGPKLLCQHHYEQQIKDMNQYFKKGLCRHCGAVLEIFGTYSEIVLKIEPL